MECIFCGSWFASSNKEDKVCSPCDKALKKLRLGIEPEKLSELAKAEKAGRLVVPPCKVGDEVYFPVEGRWDSAIIEHIEIYADKVLFTWVQYDIGPEINELWDEGAFTLDDIGKNVFLTRQEAEEALGKGEQSC